MREPPSSGTGASDARAFPLVLAVDDEPAVLRAMGRMLGDLPIRLLCVGSAEEALEVLRAQTPAAIVCDHGLPGMSGLELLAAVRSRWPNVPTLLHSGNPLARERAAQLRFPVVEKERPDSLRETLRSLLESGFSG